MNPIVPVQNTHTPFCFLLHKAIPVFDNNFDFKLKICALKCIGTISNIDPFKMNLHGFSNPSVVEQGLIGNITFSHCREREETIHSALRHSDRPKHLYKPTVAKILQQISL